jgi:uncharacterized protein with von Willebrand factor type A (vWA) domain
MKTTKPKQSNTRNVTPAWLQPEPFPVPTPPEATKRAAKKKPTKTKQQQHDADVERNYRDVFKRLQKLNSFVEELNKNFIGSVKDSNATIHEAAEGITLIVAMFAELRARVELLEGVGNSRGPERIPPHAVN